MRDAVLAFAVPYPAAAALAFAAGAVNGYLLNRGWTFHAGDSARARARYVVVQAGGLALTTGLLSLFVHAGQLGELTAYAATLPLVTTAMFLANRTWVFTPYAAPAALRASPSRTRST
jgi:putative flippase GtrA